MNKKYEALRLALDALEETRNALAWFYDSYPQDVTQRGNELLPYVETALAEIREALYEQPAQQQELDELTAQRDKLADILTRTANALKGQPAELSSHSWHDLPEVAQQLKTAQQCKHGNEPASCTSSPMDCQCALDAVFEHAEQEPIAYAVYHRMGGSKTLHWPEQHSEDGDHYEYQLVPLYASPQPSKPWVGLTDDEIAKMPAWIYSPDQDGMTVEEGLETFARAIEAKLKEKNT